jgi:hypothetical protein
MCCFTFQDMQMQQTLQGTAGQTEQQSANKSCNMHFT